MMMRAGTILPAGAARSLRAAGDRPAHAGRYFEEEAWEEGIACWQVTVTFAKRSQRGQGAGHFLTGVG